MQAMFLCHCRFVKWLALQGDALQESGSVLKGRRCAVFGVGSSAYPRFCAAAESMRALLLAAGVLRMLAACFVNLLACLQNSQHDCGIESKPFGYCDDMLH
jgi:Flavodoxin